MNDSSEYMPDARGDARHLLLANITDKLGSLDERELSELDRWLAAHQPGAEPPPAGPAQPAAPLSRRQFLGTLAISSAALVASNTATALISLERGSDSGQRQVEQELKPRITRLQDLLALYRRLEEIDLDEGVLRALGALGPLVKAASQGARLLLLGVGVVEFGLAQVEVAQAALADAVEFVRGLISALEETAAQLWRLLGEVTGIALPISDALGALFDSIITKIPFGIGARIEQVLQWIKELIAPLPETLASIRGRLLRPLDLEWLDPESEVGLNALLLTPVRDELITPAKDLAAELANLEANWETAVEAPLQEALAERAEIRAQIEARHRGASDDVFA